jgi:hypothetical protein
MRHVAVLAALSLVLASLAMFPASSAVADAPAPPALLALPNNVPAAERFGVGVNGSFGTIADYDVSQLHVGWYSDWGFRSNPSHPAGLNYVQIIYVRAGQYPPNWNAVAAAIAANPGSLWIIGNEPEAILQGNRTPSEYAAIYHEAYTFVKAHDPTAAVAIGGVIQPSPLRLRWLDEVLAAYQSSYGVKMPVDVWNTHMQILRERGQAVGCDGCFGAFVPAGLTDVTEGLFSAGEYRDDPLLAIAKNADPSELERMIRDLRAWMKSHGEQNKPLIISEYGVLYPSDYVADSWAEGDQRILDFMTSTFDFLVSAADPNLGYPADGNRLVQRWLWYSLNSRMPIPDGPVEDFNGSLFDWQAPHALTIFGEHLAAYTAPIAPTFVDLAPRDLVVSPAIRFATGAVTTTASVAVTNLGTAGASNVRVAFYEGASPITGTLVAETNIPVVPARYHADIIVQASWCSGPADPRSSSPRVFVVVDPQSNVDTDRTNNTISRSVPMRRVYLPIARRRP